MTSQNYTKMTITRKIKIGEFYYYFSRSIIYILLFYIYYLFVILFSHSASFIKFPPFLRRRGGGVGGVLHYFYSVFGSYKFICLPINLYVFIYMLYVFICFPNFKCNTLSDWLIESLLTQRFDF